MNGFPYGSVLSWRVPPDKNKFFTRVFGKLQLIFTGRKETHSSILLDKTIDDKYYEFESSKTTRIALFEGNEYVNIFDIKAPEQIKREIINELIKEEFGKIYGLVQTVYFVFRWFMEKLHIDVRRWINPFGFLSICSKLVYLYLLRLSLKMEWDDLTMFLLKWNKNTCHSGDIRIILNFMVGKDYAEHILKSINED